MSQGLGFDEKTSRRIEALYRSPDAIRRRSRVLDLLAPRSGGRVLDVGCGPGFLASELGAAVSMQVHEYVRGVERSLRDLARGLRPGGRALVVATDWDSIVRDSGDPERMARVLSAFEEHLAHMHLPRRLGSLLAEAGLALRGCEVLVQFNPVLDPNTFGYGLMELIRRFVPGRRGVTREEADAWAEDLRARGARGAAFFSLNQYLFLAVKP